MGVCAKKDKGTNSVGFAVRSQFNRMFGPYIQDYR
jgi:glutamate dehydrogenase/leucine dehydrogenase